MNSKKIRKAVFPVGGLGTRFLPVTKSLPKEMLPVANMPIIQHVFQEAVSAGIEEFIFITGRNKNIISDHFDHAYELEKNLSEKEKFHVLGLTKQWLPDAGKIAFIRQQHPNGLGHAIWCARHFINDEAFAVLLPDELILTDNDNTVLKNMVELYNGKGGNIVALAEVEKSQTFNYGIIKHDQNPDSPNVFNITDMIEKPSIDKAPSNLSIAGRYILQSSIFDVLSQTAKDANGEIQLTDALQQMIKTTKTWGYKFDAQRFDCGSQLGFLKANIEYSLTDKNIGNDLKDFIKNLAKRLI